MRLFAADIACMRNNRNITWQIPYATSTPSASDANTAHTNINVVITTVISQAAPSVRRPPAHLHVLPQTVSAAHHYPMNRTFAVCKISQSHSVPIQCFQEHYVYDALLSNPVPCPMPSSGKYSWKIPVNPPHPQHRLRPADLVS
jgi:hypothetical protein